MRTDITHLNLGCGTNKLPAPWKNFDYDMDITKPLPIASGTVEKILIEHCLEHVSGPKGFRFLQEAYRVLKPGGVIRVCVPELERLDKDSAIDIIVNHGHEVVFDFKVISQLLYCAGFDKDKIIQTGRDPIDGHWTVIGVEKDDRETLRVEATK